MSEQKWYYFTFGCGQLYEGYYVKFYGTYDEARQRMVDRYGLKWGFQYSEEEWNAWVEKANREFYPVEKELKS